jgi:hypothetical protein
MAVRAPAEAFQLGFNRISADSAAHVGFDEVDRESPLKMARSWFSFNVRYLVEE